MKNSNILKITIPVFAVAVCLLTVAQAVPVEVPDVDIDLKPGSCPNCVNPDSRGRVAVAILGSADLDVLDVDQDTVQLEGVSAQRCSVEDVNDDGFSDLVCHFKTLEVTWPQNEACADVRLTAELNDGTPIEGIDLACKPGESDCNDEICNGA